MGTRLSVEGGTAVCTSRSSGVALGQLADAQQRAAPPPWSRGLGGARGDADGQQTAELRPGGEEGDSSGRGDLEVGVADGVEHRRAGDPFGPAEQRDEVYQQVGGRREDSQPGAPAVPRSQATTKAATAPKTAAKSRTSVNTRIRPSGSRCAPTASTTGRSPATASSPKRSRRWPAPTRT